MFPPLRPVLAPSSVSLDATRSGEVCVCVCVWHDQSGCLPPSVVTSALPGWLVSASFSFFFCRGSAVERAARRRTCRVSLTVCAFRPFPRLPLRLCCRTSALLHLLSRECHARRQQRVHVGGHGSEAGGECKPITRRTGRSTPLPHSCGLPQSPRLHRRCARLPSPPPHPPPRDRPLRSLPCLSLLMLCHHSSVANRRGGQRVNGAKHFMQRCCLVRRPAVQERVQGGASLEHGGGGRRGGPLLFILRTRDFARVACSRWRWFRTDDRKIRIKRNPCFFVILVDL